MRLLGLIVVLFGVAGYYLFGGRTITPEEVAEFYDRQYRATMKRDPKALCDLLADDYVGVGTTINAGRRIRETVDKKQSCEATQSFFDDLAKLGAARGGILRLGYRQDIGNVSIADDKRSAKVDSEFKMTVSGRLMIFESTSVDTLVRKRWRVYMQRSESTTTVEMN